MGWLFLHDLQVLKAFRFVLGGGDGVVISVGPFWEVGNDVPVITNQVGNKGCLVN